EYYFGCGSSKLGSVVRILLTNIILFCAIACSSTNNSFIPVKEKDKRNNWFRVSLYLEGLGKSLVYSANIEYRFKKRIPRFALNAGYGSINLQPAVFMNRTDSVRHYKSIPVGFSILAGNNGNYLEMALGHTWIEKNFEFFNVSANLTKYEYYYAVIGYRFHGIKGYHFRIYYAPSWGKESGFHLYYVGVSAGYILGAQREERKRRKALEGKF
ncbi:MAG: hypothetical protein KJ607_06470, partial [Bacteroidetes bacterium]|nr:hypothetical protein [Bacteroidota bacterium]